MKSRIDPLPNIEDILEIKHSQGLIKRLKKFFCMVLLVGPLTAVVLFWHQSGNSAAVQYKTELATRGDITVIVTATGTLEPTNTVSVGSELSGIIKSVEVNCNDIVQSGQILARLDTSKLEAQLTQAKAALEEAKAKELQAEATVLETQAKLNQLQKVRELSQGKVPSQTEMDAAEAAYKRATADAASAKASVSKAKASLQAIQTDISKSVIRSPINGIVLTREIEPGQTVAASFNTPVLFTIAEDLKEMELHVDVDEADIGKVQEGQTATFSVSAYPNVTFQAQIVQTRFAATTTSGVVTYETILTVNNPDLILRPGMTATTDITVQKIEDAVLVPSKALRFSSPVRETSNNSRGIIGSLLPRPPRASTSSLNLPSQGNQQKVWVLRDGQLTSIEVTTGATGGLMTEIVSGEIQPGMEVVVDTVTGAS